MKMFVWHLELLGYRFDRRRAKRGRALDVLQLDIRKDLFQYAYVSAQGGVLVFGRVLQMNDYDRAAGFVSAYVLQGLVQHVQVAVPDEEHDAPVGQ